MSNNKSSGIEISMVMPQVGFDPIAPGDAELQVDMFPFDPDVKQPNYFDKEDDREYPVIKFKLTCISHSSHPESVGRTDLVTIPLGCEKRSRDFVAYIDAMPDNVRAELGWFHDSSGDKYPVGVACTLKGLEEAHEIISGVPITAKVKHKVVEATEEKEKRTYVTFYPQAG